MSDLFEAITLQLSDKMPTTPYFFGSSRPPTGPTNPLPKVTAVERDLAGETSYQTGGADIQRIMLVFNGWSIAKNVSDSIGNQVVAALSNDSTWRPVWTGGKLIDAYQSGVTTTNESDQVDSNNRVIWVSESVIEFLVTRE